MVSIKRDKSKQNKGLEWDYQAPKINSGKETIDEMSLITGMHGNYQVIKTGQLAGILSVSGINLDLLSEAEQQDVFADYGAFLMSTLGAGVNDSLQFIELTVPVNMTAYINGLKHKYFELEQLDNPTESEKFKTQLVASYLDHFTTIQNNKNMTTKQHLVVVKVAIKDKKLSSLKVAVEQLDEKMAQVQRDLENALTDFDVVAKPLSSIEVQGVLKNLINYNG